MGGLAPPSPWYPPPMIGSAYATLYLWLIAMVLSYTISEILHFPLKQPPHPYSTQNLENFTWTSEVRRLCANYPCNCFRSTLYLYDHDTLTLQTDRWTDGQHQHSISVLCTTCICIARWKVSLQYLRYFLAWNFRCLYFCVVHKLTRHV